MRVQTKKSLLFLEHMGFFGEKIDLSLPYDDKSSGPICFPLSHCYFIRLNLRKMVPFYFYLLVFLGIFWHLKQKEFLDFCEGFLRVPLTGTAIQAHSEKMLEWHFFNPCIKFGSFWIFLAYPSGLMYKDGVIFSHKLKNQDSYESVESKT